MPGRNSEGCIEQRDIVILMMLIAAIDIFIIVSLSVLLKNAKYDLKETASFNEDMITQSDQAKDIAKTQEKEKERENGIHQEETYKEEREYDDSISSSMVSLYTSLIAGDHVVNGLHFHFGSKGDYSGFFDGKHEEVVGYKYEIVSNSENLLLNIYNQQQTRRVTYYLILSDDMSVILYYPQSDMRVVL